MALAAFLRGAVAVMARGEATAVLGGALAAVRAADDTLVLALNATARRSPPAARVVGRLAAWLAGVEVVLMVALGRGARPPDLRARTFSAALLGHVCQQKFGRPRPGPKSGLSAELLAGRRGSAVRMLAAVGLVYVLSEALGVLWPRRRPFAQLAGVERLAPHSAERSFPSRHIASGLAMAAVGGQAHPRLGAAMATVAWALGLSRVAAGLHYPSDVLGGALLGVAVGRLALSRPGSPARPGRS